MEDSNERMQMARQRKRPDRANIERAIIDLLIGDTQLMMLQCMTDGGFKPICGDVSRANTVLSKVAELEGELGYSPTTAVIASALMGVDKELKYTISGDDSRAKMGGVRKVNLYRDDAGNLHDQWVKIKRALDRRTSRGGVEEQDHDRQEGRETTEEQYDERTNNYDDPTKTGEGEFLKAKGCVVVPDKGPGIWSSPPPAAAGALDTPKPKKQRTVGLQPSAEKISETTEVRPATLEKCEKTRRRRRAQPHRLNRCPRKPPPR